MNKFQRSTRYWSMMGAAVAVALATAAVLRACDTPVFRYAMYNWAQAPYLVFYFDQGKPTEADRKINELIEKMARAEPASVNIALEAIDSSDSKQLKSLPEEVIAAAEGEAGSGAKGGKTKPRYLVYTPWGGLLFSGQLDAATLKAMVDSPARQQTHQLLADGYATVLLLLTGTDAKATAAAESAIAEAIERVGQGGVAVSAAADPLAGIMPAETSMPAETNQADGSAQSPASGASAGEAAESALKVATIKIDRDDPKEKWFVRNLRLIEPDLNEAKYVEQPMVFAAYGRGRALEPYIGKGIVADNLVECVAFLAGACSCMVKDENPGADLLVKWDWEGTADQLAQNDPTLTADDPTYYSADEGNTAAAPASEGAEEQEAAATATGGPEAAATPAEQKSDPVEPGKPAAEAAGSRSNASPSSRERADAATAATTSAAPVSSIAGRQTLVLGMGLGLAAAGLVAGSLVAFFRRSS